MCEEEDKEEKREEWGGQSRSRGEEEDGRESARWAEQARSREERTEAEADKEARGRGAEAGGHEEKARVPSSVL